MFPPRREACPGCWPPPAIPLPDCAALWLGESSFERVLMIGSVLLLLIVELLNTAVESVVNRVGLEFHELSRQAKDIGSAAVFLAMAMVALVWIGLLI